MSINWDGIYEQELTKQSLTRLIESNRVPHALLFYGPDGVGKDFTAIRFAQNLNSNSGNSNIYNKIAELSEPYIKYIFPLPRGKNETDQSGPFDKLSTDEIDNIREELDKKIRNPYHKIKISKAFNIKISSIREIKKYISLNYEDILYRIILISDAHLMNEEAQNALLKNLEEPPAGVIFILTTPFPDLLRETIRSRCWGVHFQPLSESSIKEVLMQHYNSDRKTAENAALISGGSVSAAVTLLEKDIEYLLEKTINILRFALGHKYNSAIDELSAALGDGDPNSLGLLIELLNLWFIDLQKFRAGTSVTFYKSYTETFQKFDSKFPDLDINKAVTSINRLNHAIKSNANPSLVILNLISTLSSLTLKFK